MRVALSLLLVAIASAGCRAGAPAAKATPPGPSVGEPAPVGDALTGPVLEQLAAPPYRYLKIRTAGGEVWAAVPEAQVENGAVVTVVSPMLMKQFASSSLNRTFDEVYFGTLASGAPAPAPAAAGDNPHAGVPMASAAPVEVGKVEKAAGPDGHTVAELWARMASLEGRTVTVRGVVVKVNNGVMGKNWIHLQDGTGAAGTNDLTVTTMDRVTRGETVTIRGTVRTDRDFGAGYSYPVIVEDATIVK